MNLEEALSTVKDAISSDAIDKLFLDDNTNNLSKSDRKLLFIRALADETSALLGIIEDASQTSNDHSKKPTDWDEDITEIFNRLSEYLVLNDSELVSLLEMGPQYWNKWRDILDPIIKTDKTRTHEVKLRNAALPQKKYTGYNFRDVVFSGCRFSSVEFEHSDFWNATFRKVDFNSSSFSDCVLRETELSDCRSIADTFINCEFTRSLVEQCDFGQTRFETCDWRNSTFRRVDLTGASLKESDLRGVEGLELNGTNIRYATFDAKPKDKWARMRRYYTGTRLAIALILLAVFVAPFALKSGFWIGVNQLQVMSGGTATDSRYQNSLDGGGNLMHESFHDESMCMHEECVEFALWEILLGIDEGIFSVILTVSLFAYNIIRGLLTAVVVQLREDEERTGFSPFKATSLQYPLFSEPSSTKLGMAEFLNDRYLSFKASTFVIGYDLLYRIHILISVFLVISVMAFMINSVKLLTLSIWLPA